MEKEYIVTPDVLTYEKICEMAPFFKGRPKLVERIFRWLWIDKVNYVHGKYCYETGVPFSHLLIEDQFKINLKIDNEEILNRFPGSPFITVSNHPFGALDGILLLHLVGKHHPDFKVMVNMFLNYLSAMQPTFIAVDPAKTDDPEKRKVTMQGIREAMKRVKEGHPVGFFPAGAVSKIDKSLRIRDRKWQPTIVRIIKQMKVPVIPIYFHGHNSTFFNILGLIDWRLRTLRLPRELFNKTGKTVHVTIGEPIMPETIEKYDNLEQLAAFLRQSTDSLRHHK